jgi:hypothetical protein
MPHKISQKPFLFWDFEKKTSFSMPFYVNLSATSQEFGFGFETLDD